jgi:hypothetical protein
MAFRKKRFQYLRHLAVGALSRGKINAKRLSYDAMKSQVLPHSTKNYDAVLLFCAVLALGAELSLLLHQLRLIQIPFLSDRVKQSASGIGELLQKSRSVQSRSPGSLSWYPLVEGDAILRDETVMTGSGASAVIRMKEGTELVLEPYTLLRFSRDFDVGRGQLALEVNQGVIKLKSHAKALQVAVGDREVQLAAGSEATLSAATGSESAEFAVVEGTASVLTSSKDPAVELKAGDAVSIPDRGQLTPIARLLIESPLPKEGEVLFTRSVSMQVNFSWKANGSEIFEWDTAPKMAKATATKLTSQRSSLNLAPGKYYWRLRTAKAVSPVASFAIVAEPDYQVDTKVTRTKVKEGVEADLRWIPVPGAKSYHVRIAKDASFKKIDREFSLPGNETQVAGLTPGVYFWKIQAVHSEWGNLPESKPFPLRVSKKMSPPQVRGAKVVPLRKPSKPPQGSWRRLPALIFIAKAFWLGDANAETAEKIPVEFSWDAVPGARAYRLEVSTRKDFKNVVSSSEGSRSMAVIPLPARERYYWRVAAIDEDGDLGSFSKVQSVFKILATVDSPSRSIAESPAPTSVLPAVEPPEPPRARFLRSWFGYGGTYFTQQLQNQDSLVRASGTPLNRFILGAKQDLAQASLEAHLWAQPLRYVNVSDASSFTRLQWGVDAFASRLWWRKALPLGVGFRLRTEQIASALSSSSVTLGGAISGSLLFGTDWVRGNRFPWFSSVWLEVTPLGEKRGAGIVWRNRLGLPWKISGLAPSLEVVVNPYYRQSSFVPLSELSLEVTLALTFGFEESLPTLLTKPQ